MSSSFASTLRSMSRLALVLALLALVCAETPLVTEGYLDPECVDGQECCYPGASPVRLGSPNVPRGFWSPNLNVSDASTWPTICPESPKCSIDRAASFFCQAQGRHEPVSCPPGYYCPTPTERLPCPSGYYCRRGTYEPVKCSLLSHCPEGSDLELYWGSILWVVLADVGLLMVVIMYRFYRAKFRAARHAVFVEQSESSIVKKPNLLSHAINIHSEDVNHEVDDDDNSCSAKALPVHTRRLCRGFHRAKNNLRRLDFVFDNLSLALPNGKKLLSGVTGRVAPGKVTAIMGPSGAGKTTFLNTLMGKVDQSWSTQGTLTINGVEMKMSKLKQLVGFVPQEDVMIRELSVCDNIGFAAQIRLPKDWTDEEKTAHARAVVQGLQLSHVCDVPIGDESERGISGGQRKRVNIGMELAAAPLALFLDEPTSGLDSAVAMDVCTLLKDIAVETGITVAMVIHQPRVEIWNSLDYVLLLAPGGRTVYLGPQRLAQQYFVNHLNLELRPQDNPADVIMDAIAVSGESFVKTWSSTGHAYLQRLLNEQPEPILMVSPPATADKSMDVSRKVSPSEIELGPIRVHDDVKRANQVQSPLPSSDPSAASSAPSSSSGSFSEENYHHNHFKAPVFHKSASGNNLAAHAGVVTIRPVTPSHFPAQAGQSNYRSEKDESMDCETSACLEKMGHRETASLFRQTLLCHIRSVKQQHETFTSVVLELGVAIMAGAMIGAGGVADYQGVFVSPFELLSASPIEWLVPQMGMFICMAVGLAASSAGVKTYGEEKVVYWREVASGHSAVAYFIGTSTAMIYRVALAALHFAMIYHIMTSTIMPFGDFYLVIFMCFYAVYGIAASVSMVVKREDAPLVAVVLSLMMAGCSGYIRPLPLWLKYLSYAYWTSEAIFTKNVAPSIIFQSHQISAPYWSYSLNEFGKDVAMIFVIGTIWRILAYVLMRVMHRDKQR